MDHIEALFRFHRGTNRPMAHTRPATTGPTNSLWPPRTGQPDHQCRRHHDEMAPAKLPRSDRLSSLTGKGSEGRHPPAPDTTASAIRCNTGQAREKKTLSYRKLATLGKPLQGMNYHS